MDEKMTPKEINGIISYAPTDDILCDVQGIIDASQQRAYQAVNLALVQRNWLVGQRIADETMKGDNRAEYGSSVIKSLSKELTKLYGKGYTKTNLYNFYMFYKTFPEIFHSASGKFDARLTWTHYRILLQVKDTEARNWYAKEASEQTWSVRTLQRNISSQYYYRLLKSQAKEAVTKEMHGLTEVYQQDKFFQIFRNL